VIQGGNWGHYDWDCPAAYRNYYDPASRSANVGFRLAMSY
jgi:formylglycine-generating enzyme required for sulfatase activity